jgi:predicted RNase H-like HicB family nuclease
MEVVEIDTGETIGGMHLKYTIRQLTAEEGSGWIVEFPDLPGIIGTGDTKEEAIEDAMDARNGWLRGNPRGADVVISEIISKLKNAANIKCTLNFGTTPLEYRGQTFRVRNYNDTATIVIDGQSFKISMDDFNKHIKHLID